MPNWKKVILSGSNAHLNNISASGHFSALDGGVTANTNSGNEGILNITNDSDGAINIDSILGVINFIGTGSGIIEGPSVKIEAVAAEDFDLNRKGAKINFYTADSNTATLGNPKMVISESGILFDPSNNGYEVGISQEKVGGSATMEFTTQDGGGSQATRLLLRGNGEFGDIEFYSGNSGSETQIGAISSEFASFAFGSDFGTGTILDDNIKKATILAFGNISTTGSEGHITASGNISASGYISSSYAYISENGGSKPTLTIERQAGQPNIQSTNWFIADATGSAANDPNNKAAINYWSDRHILLANGGGNVGIGPDFGSTTDPGERLEVRGNISASGTIKGTSATFTNVGTFGSSVTAYSLRLSNLGSQSSPAIAFSSDVNTGIYSPAPDNINIQAGGGTAELQISTGGVNISAGDLGVNQTIEHISDTDTKIDFTDDQIDFTAGGVTFLTLEESTNDTFAVNNGGTEDIDFKFYHKSDPNPVFYLDGGTGKVGIGTLASTITPNTVNITHTGVDGNEGIMIIRDDTTVVANELLGGIGFDSRDGNVPSSILEASAYIAAYADQSHGTTAKGGRLEFGVAKTNEADDTVSSPVLAIEHTATSGYGRVGINDTTPGYPLDVKGNNSSFILNVENTNGSTGSDGIRLACTTQGNDVNRYYLQIRNGGTICGSIRQGVSINTTNFNEASDRKLKTDIKDSEYSVEDLMKVKIRDFKWKSDNTPGIGVIAQELNKVLPNLTYEPTIIDGEKTPWEVNYGGFIPYLIKSIQDQQHLINDLQNQINELKTKK